MCCYGMWHVACVPNSNLSHDGRPNAKIEVLAFDKDAELHAVALDTFCDGHPQLSKVIAVL